MAKDADTAEEHVVRMRKVLLATASACGIATAASLRFDQARRSFAIGDTRVTVTLERRRDADSWLVGHSFEVVDLSTGRASDASEVVGEFAPDDVVGAVRAAVMRAVEMVVDFAIDRAG